MKDGVKGISFSSARLAFCWIVDCLQEAKSWSQNCVPRKREVAKRDYAAS